LAGPGSDAQAQGMALVETLLLKCAAQRKPQSAHLDKSINEIYERGIPFLLQVI
jgi:hypothetical protein